MIQISPEDKTAVDKLYGEAIVIDATGGDIVPTKLSPHKAGITAMNTTVVPPHADFMGTMRGLYLQFTYLDALPDTLLLVRSVEDIYSAKKTGRLGVMFGIQDGSPLEGDLTLLTILYQLGLRIMTLTYNERNLLGTGCVEPIDQGLTSFGRQVVRETDRLGIVLDCSHSSERTTLDAMEIKTKPPIFSHSNPYSLTPSQRCITDDQIKAAAALDGVIGITVWSPMAYSTPGQQPTLDDYLNRIDYVVDLVGIDHVGIGTDIFEGHGSILWRATTKRRYPEVVGKFDRHNIHVKGFESHLEIRNVAYGLKSRGYSDVDIRKVLGENFLRVFSKSLS